MTRKPLAKTHIQNCGEGIMIMIMLLYEYIIFYT